MSGEESSTGNYKLSIISNSSNIVTNATLATLKFKLLDNVQAGEKLDITLSSIELGDSNGAWIDISNKQVSLSVIESANTQANKSIIFTLIIVFVLFIIGFILYIKLKKYKKI